MGNSFRHGWIQAIFGILSTQHPAFLCCSCILRQTPLIVVSRYFLEVVKHLSLQDAQWWRRAEGMLDFSTHSNKISKIECPYFPRDWLGLHVCL